MVIINTVLDKRKIKKDDTYPISFRIYHLGKTRMISSKISIEEKYWDEKKKLIKVSHSNGEALNRHITKQLADSQCRLHSGGIIINEGLSVLIINQWIRFIQIKQIILIRCLYLIDRYLPASLMLTNKKYKSDKIVIPLIVLLGIASVIIYVASDNKILLLVSLIAFITTMLGVPIYRNFLEQNWKGVLYNGIALILLYSYLVVSALYLNPIKL